jgi:penicillin-binding protein 1A
MDSKAEQYYPTYKAKDRDILLIEFEEAQKIANGQTRVYGQVTNILIAVVTLMIPLFFPSEDSDIAKTLLVINENSLLFSFILFLFGGFLLRYFVELQKQITINARKVVTLRTLLGLDYGSIHLTLPNLRVEGANNPFAIRYFNGWLRFESFPFWILFIGINSIWWFATKNIDPFEIGHFSINQFKIPWILGNIIITISYLYIFRTNLNDKHETNYLNCIKKIAWILGIDLSKNFEYVLYRAKLSSIELDRLKVNFESLKKILVDVEDVNFYKNKGVSIKSLIRGFISHSPFIRKRLNLIRSGGSTITMQLSRSLFIPSTQYKIRRKIVEILLSLWLAKQFSKDEILRLYVASVRFEKGVFGLSNAIKYFFGELKTKTLTNEESFFLIERLSNISSSIRWDRINHLKTRTKVELVDTMLTKLYDSLIKNGTIKYNVL